MTTERFFDETTEQSLVKTAIVSKYFWAWAKVIIPTAKRFYGKIAYIDLFAGPGRYKDGTMSTPLLILEKAIQDSDMRQMLVTFFNDVDSDKSRSLETAINSLPGVETLKYRPKVNNEEVGEKIVNEFEGHNLIPTLFFVDPWGYKGLSLRLINSVLKNWGCDCIFFFNYNRINMGLPNEAVDEHMNALFGEDRANRLRQRLETLQPDERELAIVEEIAQALSEMGGEYVLPFCFKNEKGNRTSHHLIFVSKNIQGYKIMKDIMAGESSKADQGVPSFTYSPTDWKNPLLFELTRPLEDLESMLLDEFAGRSMKMHEVFDEHNVGRPFIERNYKQVLKKMEAEGRITADPPASKRRKYKGEVTFGPDVVVTFPQKAS
ncbi:MAG TPA: three-Cys-motif partner protein TcmP [Pyrinomonadaceae bacterium]|nr:three-Cys-motif partner protein TcmP [Pyrinomonadaceae bacterium]